MDDIKNQLKDFPSLFDFKSEELIRQKRVSSTITKLQTDDEATTNSTEERIKISNFISYLHYLDGNLKKAFEIVDKSLVLECDNISANVIKCHLFLEDADVYEAEKKLQYIMELKDKDNFQQKTHESMAGLAYAYGSSGPSYQNDAEKIYRKIIHECPTMYEWKFGLGLSVLRQTHIVNSPKKTDFEQRNRMLIEALQLFKEIADNTKDTNRTLCAKVWVEIGDVLYSNEKQFNDKRIRLPQNLHSLCSKDCIDKALKICQDDVFVLTKCGRFYRYFGDIAKSEEFLRKAKGLHDSCFANHQLALTLQRKVCHTNQNQDPNHKKNMGYIKGTLKSPREVTTHPDNTILLEAEGYLRKAVEISNGENIMYDLALLYRYLGQPHDALATLNEITAFKERYLSSLNVINVYEQKGMCCLDMKERTVDLEEKEKYKVNAEHLFCKAIELQIALVKEEQELKSAWNSYPTLKSLLDRNSGNCSLRRLATAHQMMDDFEEAIKLWELLQEKSSLSISDYGQLIESYIHVGNVEKAAVLLSLLQCTGQFVDLDRSVAVKASIECALQAVKENDAPIAASRFRSAYQAARRLFGEKDTESSHQTTGRDGTDSNELQIVNKCSKSAGSLPYDEFITLLKKFTDLKVGEVAVESSIFSIDSRENKVIFLDMELTDSVEEELSLYLDRVRATSGKVIFVATENTWTHGMMDSLNFAVVRLPAKNTDARGEGETTFEEKEREITILKKFFEKLCEID